MSIGPGLGVAGVLFVLLLVAIAIAYTGGYNIAATQDQTTFVRWAFTTTMHSSAKNRAAKISPPEFTDAMVEQGAVSYKAVCQHCHAGPGAQRSEWAELPQPPHLVEKASEWQPNEIFWLVKHGVKMAGMPAFGPTHEDDTLWSITAFVRQLPAMTAEDYTAYGSEGSSGSHGH